MTRIRLAPQARRELTAAAQWYNEEEPGLGADFVLQVDEALQRIGAGPGRFPLWREDRPYRRAQTHRFPYLIFFREVDDEVWVFAVAHRRRKPGYWLRRDRPKTL